jgi:DNA-binding NarL/FixJ family response regulator
MKSLDPAYGAASDKGALVGPVRILLADDQREMLETVSQLFNDKFDIVATAQDGEQAIGAAARLDPAIVVLDISMPVLSGIEAPARLKESGCKAKVIFLTVHDDPDYVEAAFSVGVLGYVLKPRLAVDLLPAMREVLQGRTFVSPPLGTGSDGHP